MLALAFALLINDPLGPAPRIPWIASMDYPSALRVTKPAGITEVQLGFDLAGRVTSCTVTKSSGTALLDALTCRLSVRRGRAKPDQPRVQVHQHKWAAPTGNP